MSSTIKLPEDFQRLDLPEELGRAILDLGFESCTPVQNQVLPHSLDGKDIIAQAQTGTGKTAAFLLSIITYDLENPSIDERPDGTPYALVIAPTRELVIQITNDAESLTKYTDLNVVSLVGGMDYDRQRSKLNKRVDVVVATPGRLLDFARNGVVDLSEVEILVMLPPFQCPPSRAGLCDVGGRFAPKWIFKGKFQCPPSRAGLCDVTNRR